MPDPCVGPLIPGADNAIELRDLIDKTNGEEISSVELAFMPTFDGMITAEGMIFMTTSDGQVVCFDCQNQD